MRVYLVLEQIAQHHIDDARWVKTDDGYRLEGVSRALRPLPPNRRWLWVSGAAIAALAIGSVVIIYRRRRPKT